jgi:hypothetical protein
MCKDSERGSDFCTMDYRPVCGVWFDSNNGYYTEFTQRTFGNRCGACSNKKVKYVFEGECIPLVMESRSGTVLTKRNSTITSNCSESERNVSICTKDYKPVCGYVNTGSICPTQPCTVTFDNRCQACKRTDVLEVSEGACKENSAQKVNYYHTLLIFVGTVVIFLT